MAIILNNIKTLVGGSGVSLPSLANPGTKEDLMLNKELIDGNGNKVTGTFTIDSELNTQDDLIAMIESALDGKAGGRSEIETCTLNITGNVSLYSIAYMSISDLGEVIAKFDTFNQHDFVYNYTTNCIRNSLVCVQFNPYNLIGITTDGSENIGSFSNSCLAFKITTTGNIATIESVNNSSGGGAD